MRAGAPVLATREASIPEIGGDAVRYARSYVGEYCTSLEMAGCSLTLVKLDDEIEALLNAPAEIVARVF